MRSSDYYSQCDPDACAGARQQCGGYRHEGPQCCRAGLECVMHNRGYHQCVVAASLDMTRFERDAESSKLRLMDEGGDETPLAWNGAAAGLEVGDDEKGGCIPPGGQCDGFFFEPFLKGPKQLPCCPGDAARHTVDP